MARLVGALLLLVTVGGAALLLAAPAQAEVKLGVSPSLVELEGAPGNTGAQTITVYNDGDEPFGVSASVGGYGGASKDRLADGWIRVSPATFSLAPGQSRKVRVDIAVPSDATAGGHYASVSFQTSAKSSGQGTGVSGRLGVPQLITIKGAGPIIRRATVDHVFPVLQPDGTVGFRTVLGNPGNVHYFPSGRMSVRCESGPKGKLNVPRGTAVVPDAEDVESASGSLKIPSGSRCVTRTAISYGNKKKVNNLLRFVATPSLGVSSLKARERPGKAPKFLLALQNTGGLLLKPDVRLEVFDSGGKLLGSATPSRAPEVEPGKVANIQTEYPGRLGPGRYTLRAAAYYGGKVAQKQIGFTLGASAPEAKRLGAPEIAGPTNWWLVAGICAGVLAAISLCVRYLPQFKPVRRRVARAWKAFRTSEE